jgi:hypothetical protein
MSTSADCERCSAPSIRSAPTEEHGSHAWRARVLDRFLTWAKDRPDVWWARRDVIADWALASPEIGPRVSQARSVDGRDAVGRVDLAPASGSTTRVSPCPRW